MSFKWFCFYLLISISAAQADLTKAYSYYLIGEIDSALVYYNNVLKVDSNIIDAVYGTINCYIAKKDLSKALTVAKGAVNRFQDVTLNAKLAYLYSRKNMDQEVRSLYTRTIDILNKDTINTIDTKKQLHSDYLIAAGYGFLEREKYKKALSWFYKGDSLFKGQESFNSAITLTKASINNANALSVLFNSGIINYSKDAVYKYGNFFGASTGFLIQNHNYVKFLFNRTKLHYNDLEYGINYDTLLAKNSEHPDQKYDKLLSSKKYTDLNGNPDTVFYTYREFFLPGNGDLKRYDYTTTVTPDDLAENDYLISLTNYRQIVPSTNFNAGYRYTHSNIASSKNVNTLFFKHETFFDSLHAGIQYFFTLADDNKLYQASPSIGYTLKNIKFDGTLNLIKSGKHDDGNRFPEKVQISSDLNLHISLKTIKISSGVFFGERVFLNSEDGEVFYNVLAPTKFGEKEIIEWSPVKNFTLFYLFRFSKFNALFFDKVNYPEYWSMTHMGGIYFQW
jgi:hypothetical protein